MTAEDIDRIVRPGKGRPSGLDLTGICPDLKGFHRFLQACKAAEIDASFGVRLVCLVDELKLSRHVGDDSPASPPPTPERVVEFFEFIRPGRVSPEIRSSCTRLRIVPDAVTRPATPPRPVRVETKKTANTQGHR